VIRTALLLSVVLPAAIRAEDAPRNYVGEATERMLLDLTRRSISAEASALRLQAELDAMKGKAQKEDAQR
jgi:hypothetical protein